MKIYVASSWKNATQPAIVAALRADGHEVYDFREHGFQWQQVDAAWASWTAGQFREALYNPLAQRGFELDSNAIEWADAIVAVAPFGRSTALELGWGRGAGKYTAVLLAPDDRPELMYKCADRLCLDADDLRAWLAAQPPPVAAAAPLRGTAAHIAQVCDDLKAFLLRKNAAYGDAAVNPLRVFSRASPEEQIRVRLDDKLSRLARGHALSDESLADTVDDILGYLVLLKVEARTRATADAEGRS